MDFTLTDEQNLLVETVQNFVKKDSPVSRLRQVRAGELGYSKKTWQQMAELGWLSIPIPESAGGLGWGLIDVALLLQQFGQTLVPEPYIPSVVLAGMTLAAEGSATQHEQILQPMMEGETTLAMAYAEKDSRHDVTRIETRAERDGDGYVLSGEKTWVLNGHAADHIVVSARTAGAPGEAQGVTLFAIPADAKGLSRKALKTIDGQWAAHLTLEGVKLGADAVIGTVGDGSAALEAAMDRGAAMACAEGAGIVAAVFGMTKEYLGERTQFAVKIGSFQALQHRCVDMFVEVQLCESTMILGALKAADPDVEERRRAASIAKVQLAMGGHYVTRQGIQLHGGIGVTEEHDVGLYFKRMNVLASLFGDEQHHLQRYGSAPGFEGSDAA